MYGNPDPYNTGTPKYRTASEIYEALCEVAQADEKDILSEMFPDVSYHSQDYYYADKGYKLKEKFEELSDYGDKMWLMELAVAQIEISDKRCEIHDTIFMALMNDDMAKRIGFKQIFTDTILYGLTLRYQGMAEAFADELRELDRFDYMDMVQALYQADQALDKRFSQPPNGEYKRLCHKISDKIRNLRMSDETRLIAESRALLNSYDDFMLGLKMNQALYQTQLRQCASTAASLQASYKEKLGQLYLLAEKMGISTDAIMELPKDLPEIPYELSLNSADNLKSNLLLPVARGSDSP
jgi:hypothetical protein